MEDWSCLLYKLWRVLKRRSEQTELRLEVLGVMVSVVVVVSDGVVEGWFVVEDFEGKM